MWKKTTFVSSANKTSSNTLEVLQISFIYNKNSSGPKIEPCGTPHWSNNIAGRTMAIKMNKL